MSMILTMTAAAVIAGLSLTQVSLAAVVAFKGDKENYTEGLETIFTDAKILQKTLGEMDCHMKVISENEIYVETTCGQLCYKRANAQEAFKLYLNNVTDKEGLVANIKSFEADYGKNVQDYTYHHIKDNLPENMSIENEYFDEDTLYITINVDE